jgi:hypothetical protein
MGVGASGGDTELDDKIRGLARVAAAGVVDDAAIDGSQFRVRTLADIEGLHLRALLELESAGAFGPTKEAVSLADLLHIDEALATVLCGDLPGLAWSKQAACRSRPPTHHFQEAFQASCDGG